MTSSLASRLGALPESRKKRILAALSLTEREQLEFLWPFWARPNQLAPIGDWSVWLILAGRGWGKVERAPSGSATKWRRGIVVASLYLVLRRPIAET
jgi:phage terminase large subunit-like protein